MKPTLAPTRTWYQETLAWLGEHPARFLGASVALTVALYAMPYGHYVGYPLVLLSTIAHELGHGVAAVLAGGKFHHLVINWDASGYASIDVPGRVTHAISLAGGLCGPAIVAALFFAAARRPKAARLSLFGFGLFLALAEVFLVRSLCGLLFVGAFAALFLYVSRKASELSSQILLSFLAVQLGLSVYSRGDYLFTRVAHMATGDQASDVAAMSDALFLPYWFWGLSCGAFSLLALAVGLWFFLRGASAMKSDAARLHAALRR